MSDSSNPGLAARDGASQAKRAQPSLSPAYARVDERSLADLLAFAQSYAKELRYFDADNQAAGDWSGFLAADLNELAAYLDNPALFLQDESRRAWFARPHFVLFITFVKLLQQARDSLNDFTRRHLEFYFREALALTAQPALPDRVHVLVELADRQGQYRLPAGTLLDAGEDGQGRPLRYRTLQDLLANRASVAELKSLAPQQRLLGFREVHGSIDAQRLLPVYPALGDIADPQEKAFWCLISLALGEPTPGASIPAYSPALTRPPLGDLDKLLAFIRTGLGLNLPAFRALMQLKAKLDAKADGRWADINAILQTAGRSRSAGFTAPVGAVDDFDTNLLAALGRKAWDGFFDTLPAVDDVYDLYRLRERADVRAFIVEDNALFMSMEAFSRLLEQVNAILRDWRSVWDILRAAAKKKAPGQALKPPNLRGYDPQKFNTLANGALGAISFPRLASLDASSFDACYVEVCRLEAYFHLFAEQFAWLRQLGSAAQPWEWEQAYALLEKARQDKVFKDTHGAKDAVGFNALIRQVLGEPNAGDPLPEGKEFLALDAQQDAAYIRGQLFLEPANFSLLKQTHERQQASDPKARPTADEWAKAYQVLSLAQTRKRGEQRVQVEYWDKLLAASRSPAAGPAWRLFGGPDAEPASTGFAIASPLLALAEGTRTIRLTLAFKAEHFDAAACQAVLAGPPPLAFGLSTGSKLVELADPAPAAVALALLPQGNDKVYRYLQATLVLSPQFPAVAACAAAPVATPWPLLQLLLRDVPAQNDAIRRAFAALALEKLGLEVKVDGLAAALLLRNDDGVVNSKSPFEPFGLQPAAGSSLYFAHPELCTKKLASLSLSFDWLGAPDNLSDYYQGYAGYQNPSDPPTSPLADNKAFTAQLSLCDLRAVFPAGSLPLFRADPNTPKTGATGAAVNNIDLQDSRQANSLGKTYPGYGPAAPPPPPGADLLDWDRYWKLELGTQDFLHALYPRAASGYAGRKKADGTAYPFIVNPPYTPKLKRLSVGYSARLDLDLAAPDQAACALYHIEPFGYRELATDPQRHWLPQYPETGEWFIGIRQLAPPQTLSLLVQIAEGSADPDAAAGPVRWSVLDGDRWLSLDNGRVLADGTGGLRNAGLVCLDLPQVAPSRLLPPESYWIRASVGGDPRGVGAVIAVFAQAVQAEWLGQDDAAEHFAQPLAAGRITQLAEPRPEVKALRQPFSAFGGRAAEQPAAFYTRVSERLRHKNRALTAWDYERLVLEAFPDVYKVRCLPVDASAGPRQADTVRLVVVPDIRGKLPFDPFGPKVPADTLAAIDTYLRGHISPLARLSVANPSYVGLQVRLGVKLKAAGNPGYYRQAIVQALQCYLAPWAYDESREIVFGGRINAHLIVNFIERLDYVDYVAGIKLFTRAEGEALPKLAGPQFLVAPACILVPEREHVVDLISDEVYQDAFFTGINYLKIELDFAIA